MRDHTAPLSGLQVIELSQNVAGPYAGLVLAQLGARVIKVERPDSGDDTRSWGPPFWNDESVMFAVMNAGKESVAIDIDDERDRRRLKDLINESDIVLSAFRPDSLERRGLDHASLADTNPGLITCSISGFGSRGPMAHAPGYDAIIQAFSGLMSITGESGRPPVRAGASIIDMGTAMWAVIAILAALRERDITGRGSHIKSSLFETGLAWLPYQIAGYLATGDEPGPLGSGLASLVPYQAFPTADRYLVVAAGNDDHWRTLCTTIGREDLAEDPSLATNPQRVERRDMVVMELTRTFRTDTASLWKTKLDKAGVPNSLVLGVGEVVDHVQTRATGMLVDTVHPNIPDFRTLGLPFRINGERPAPRGAPPATPRMDNSIDFLEK